MAAVDEAELKRLRKAAKKAAKEAAAAAEGDDEAEAKRLRKASKKAAKELAAAEEAAAAEPEEVDEEEAKRQRKAAKKAAKLAAAQAEEEVAEVPKKAKKRKESAAEEEVEEAPKAKKRKESGADVEEGKPPASLKVFIKGLPYSVDEAALRKDFEECGEITQLQFPYNDEGKPKGFAFITFANKAGFDAAVKFDNTDYGGRMISVSEANDRGKGKDGKGGKGKGKDGDWECPSCGDNQFARNTECRKCGAARPGGAGGGGGSFGKGDSKGGRDNTNTVFVRGLPWSVTEDALRKDFAECGEIEKLTFPLNEEGKPKGIAFIKYTAAEGVDAAIKFDNTDYGGRTINVSKAEDKGKGKDGKGKGKDGKGKDGKGKDGKGKGKKGKSKAPSEAKAKNTGCILESTGEKKTFDDSDDE